MRAFRAFTAASILTFAAVAVPAVAQDAAAPQQGPDVNANSVTIGVGGAYLPSYDGSNDYVFTPAGAIRGRVDGFVFFSRGTQLFLDAIPDKQASGLDFEAGPVVNYRLDRHTQIHDPQVFALGKKKAAFEAGGWVGIAKTGVITSAYDNLSFRVSYMTDVGNAHKSYIVTPSIDYGTPLSRFTYVGVSVSADYVGKGYGDYYYDITPAGSAASGLAAYTGANKKGWKKYTLGALAAHSLTGDLTHGLSVVAIGGYSHMLGAYARSPIVSVAGDKNQWVGALGLAYTF